MKFLLVVILVAFVLVVFEIQILDLHSDMRKHKCEQIVNRQGYVMKATQYDYDACIAGERR